MMTSDVPSLMDDQVESTRDSIFESRDLLAFFQRRRADGSLILICGRAACDWETDQ
jgi:hypothetical protein